MKKPHQTKAPATTSTSRPPLRFGLVLNVLAIALALLAFSQATRAVTPAPDGGYPNENTAEGTNALFSLTSDGHYNTANGFDALYSNTGGDGNDLTLTVVP